MGKGFDEFLRWEDADRDVIKVKRLYIDIADDLVAGILLSQIVYWHLPSQRNGQSKLRVQKDDKLWLAKGRGEWWDECRITPKQFDRAINLLVEKGIVEKKAFKFDGSPTIHVRLIPDVLMHYIEQQMDEQGEIEVAERGKTELAGDTNRNLPKGEIGNCPKGNNQLDQRGISLTETTTEITTETTKRDILSPYDEILDTYHQNCPSLPKVKFLTDKRRAAIRTRWRQYQDISIFEELFKKAETSDFLSGRNGKWTACNLDWLLKEANMIKVLEGSYSNRGGESNQQYRGNSRLAKGADEFANLDLSKFQFRE